MKNLQLIAIVNGGVLKVTAHTLYPESALLVYKFKKVLKSAFADFVQDEKSIAVESGIENVQQFNGRLKELSENHERNGSEQLEYESMVAKLEEYNRLRILLLNQDASIEGVNPLCFEQWFKLQNENRAVEVAGKPVDVLSGETEELLEGLLWACPED